MIKSHTTGKVPLAIGWTVTLTVIMFYMYEYFLRVQPSPMVDYFIAHYALSLEDIGMIDGAYYWTYIPMQPVVGTLLDQFGVRKPLFLAIISCVLGSILFGIENSFPSVILGRVLIGFGSAFGFVSVLKTATEWLPKKHFPLAIGVATSLGMLGAILSLTMITALIHHLGVKTTIDLSTLFGVLLLMVSYIIVYDRGRAHRSHHLSKRIAMIKKTFLSVIKNPQIWLLGFIGFALFLPTQMFSGLWGIPYFVHVKHYSPAVASHISSFLFWGWIVGAPLAGFISEYTIKDRRLLLMMSCLGCTFLTVIMIYSNIQSAYSYGILLFLLGLISSCQILVFDYATALSKRSCAGTAIAVTNMFVMFGGPIQKWVGLLIQSFSIEGLSLFTEEGFQQAFIIMPIACLLAFFITFFLKQQHTYD